MKSKLSLTAYLLGTCAVLSLHNVHAANYYWDIDGATLGAGGSIPSGTWASSGTTWSTSLTGILATSAYTTQSTDDLFFSAGFNAWGSYTIALTTPQSAKSITFKNGNVTISGTGGEIALGSGQSINVSSVLGSSVIGNNTSTFISGANGLTKTGAGTLTLNGNAAHTFTGGITVNGGNLLVDFANRGLSNTNMVVATNSLTLGGGQFTVRGDGTNNATQTVAGLTVNAGGGIINNNPNTKTVTINLGAITATAAGGSLHFIRGTGTGTITTSNLNDGSSGGGILSSRITNGAAQDWAINNGSGTIVSYTGYTTTLPTSVGSSTTNYSISTGITLTGNLAANSLKIAGSGTALALASNTLTLTSGGLLSTGSTAQTISGNTGATRLTAGDGLGGTADLLIHQYNTGGLTVSAVIGNNTAGSGNTINLVKAGTGYLVLSGANTYTGNTYVNGGILDFTNTTPSGTGANIYVAPGASVKFNAPTQTLINRIVATNEEIGIMTTSGNANALDFTNLPNAFLAGGFATNGAKTDNYTGAITPANNTYRIGFTGAAGSFGLSTVLSGANDLLVGGAIVCLTSANTFSGETMIRTTGNLLLVNTLALQNSALNLGTGSDTITGSFALSQLRTNLVSDKLVTSATLGGLSGSRNLATAYGGAYGNNAGSLSSIAVRGFTLNTGALKSHVYTGAIANFTRDTTITKSGTGTQELGGSNSYTGVTTISDGVLKIGNAAALGKGGSAGSSAGSTIVSAGGTLDLNGVTSVIEPIVLNGTGFGGNGALINNSGVAASIVGGIASLQITGGGTYTGTAPTVSLSGSGTGATATVQLGLSNASITSITGSTNWVVGDLFTTVGGGGGSGAVYEITGTTAGAITSFNLVNAGSGYTSAPTGITKLTRTGTASAGTYTFNASNFAVAGLTLTSSGSGYDNTTTASFSAGGAAATVQHSSVVLASDSSVGGSGDITIGAVVSQTGGNHSLTKVGAGTLTLSATNTYTGATAVDAGKLVISSTGSTHASSAVSVTGTASLVVNGTVGGTVNTASGTTLSGTGTIAGSATIQGIHNPGNSPGIQTFGDDLTYSGGASVLNWELTGNTTTNAANPAAIFDQMLVAGDLNFANTTTANLVFNGTGSAVNWNDALWSNSQSWLVYDVAGTTTGFANLTLTTSDWLDGVTPTPNSFNTVRGGNTFTFRLAGNDIFLDYTVVPEPSTALLGGLSLLALLRRRRK